MLPSRKFTRALSALSGVLTVMMTVMMASAVFAADPGIPYPAPSPVSDQHPASLLYFNLYTSSGTMPNLQNTRVTISNTSTTSVSIVHLFFVDGSTCSPANRYICLTANQTLSFLASEQDPGTTGYLVAVAVDSLGCPTSHNFLIGSEYVKTETGHQASLQAEGFSALYDGTAPGCDGNSTTFTILLDGNASGATPSYDRAPRVVAASKIPAVADGNDTRLVVNGVGGNLLTGANPIGNLFGFVFNDQEDPFSITVQNVPCQLYRRIDNNFPNTVGEIETDIIPAGRTGWLKVWNPVRDSGLLGSILNRNVNVGSASNAFVGGHNLHKLTLSRSNSLILPIFPPNCL